MSDFITNGELRIEAERLCDENERLESENAKLREERDHWHVEQVHAYGNWEDAHKRAVELELENTKLRELVRGLHIAHVGMTNRYKGSETGLIWEYSGDTENDTRKLESECAEECHRFDAAMRELGIEVE